MTLPLVLRIALYVLVADGVFALYLADFLGARGALLVGALLVAAWCLQPRTPGAAGRLAAPGSSCRSRRSPRWWISRTSRTASSTPW